MESKYKAGDKVRCIDDGLYHSQLTIGKIYTIVEVRTEGYSIPILRIINDSGEENGYYETRFEPEVVKPTIDDLVTLGKSLIGKTCKYIYGGNAVPEKIVVFLDEEDAGNSSFVVKEEFEKSGFCVAIKYGGNAVPVQTLTLIKDVETIKLTDDYDAIVYKDRVEVGCQTIPRAKLEELMKVMNSL